MRRLPRLVPAVSLAVGLLAGSALAGCTSGAVSYTHLTLPTICSV